MCRISGIISKNLPFNQIVQTVGLMSDILKHGGPDDQGIYTHEEDGLVFGHRRLSLIDTSSNGHQPMADTAQKIWITFNGEIYNFLELKKQLLDKGVIFRTKSDTEVIIEAYNIWGPEAFVKLKGMFAFGLYDSTQKTTYLVRDSSGIKPLYYQHKENTLIFASEVRAFKVEGLTYETDEDWRVRFLAFGYIPEPFTNVKSVLSLPKGHFLKFDNNTGKYSIHPFEVKSKSIEYITDINEAKKLVFESLQSSVRKQLISDAPIGVFLSGGIDSSLVTLLAAQQKESDLKTVSIYFNEQSYNERKYQQVVSSKIDGQKFEHLVRQEDFEKHLPTILQNMDLPTTDGINTWFICKYSHEVGLKAVLSGLGADELYGGYPSFNRIKYLKALRKLPSELFKGINNFTPDKFKKIAFLANNHPIADYLFLRGFFIPDDISKILDISISEINEILFNKIPFEPIKKYDEEQAAWFETNLYMQNQLLRDTDVMSMCHALEVRVPFLDEDFQDLASRIHPTIRFNKNQPKKMLIDSFEGLLPTEVWKRKKMGFSFPLQDWMRNNKELSAVSNYKGKHTQNYVKNFNEGKLHWSKIFALHQIQSRG
jgi:asparagine synthase (glutamine-hydrolysing)